MAEACREATGTDERVGRLLCTSRLVGDALRRNPEFVPYLAENEFLARSKRRDELVEEALGTLAWRSGTEERQEGLRRFKRRELLRIASRDLLGFASGEAIAESLANLADACVEATLPDLAPTVPFAVIGVGPLGARH